MKSKYLAWCENKNLAFERWTCCFPILLVFNKLLFSDGESNLTFYFKPKKCVFSWHVTQQQSIYKSISMCMSKILKLWFTRWSLKAKMCKWQTVHASLLYQMWNHIKFERICLLFLVKTNKVELVELQLNKKMHWNISARWNLWLKCYVQNICSSLSLFRRMPSVIVQCACMHHLRVCYVSNAMHISLWIIDIFLMLNCWKLFWA